MLHAEAPGRTECYIYAPKQVPPHLQPVINSIVEGDFEGFKAAWRPTVLGYVKALARDDTAHPLLHAAHRGRAEMVRFLLDQGLSPRQRGTVHPYTGDCMTVSELQGISPLELVNKMLFMHPRKSKRREELLAVKELLVAADLKQQAQLEAYQKQFPADTVAPGGGATPAKLGDGTFLYGAGAGGVDSPAGVADVNASVAAAVLGYDAVSTPAAARSRHAAAAAEAARRRSPSPPPAAAAGASASSSSSRPQGASRALAPASTPAALPGEGNPKRRRVVAPVGADGSGASSSASSLGGAAATPQQAAAYGWQGIGGGADTSRRTAAAARGSMTSSGGITNTGVVVVAETPSGPSRIFAEGGASSPLASYLHYPKESPLAGPKPVEVDEDAAATAPMAEQWTPAVCERVAALLARRVYPALLAPAAASGRRSCALALVGAPAGFPVPASLGSTTGADAVPVALRAFRSLAELCTAAAMEGEEGGVTAAVAPAAVSPVGAAPRLRASPLSAAPSSGFAVTTPLFARLGAASASAASPLPVSAHLAPAEEELAPAAALLPVSLRDSTTLRTPAPVARASRQLGDATAGEPLPSLPTSPSAAPPAMAAAGLSYAAHSHFTCAAAPPHPLASLPPCMAHASFPAVPYQRQASHGSLGASPADAALLVLPPSVPVPTLDAFLPLASRLLGEAVAPLAASGSLEGLPAALASLVDAAVARDPACTKARCLFDAAAQSLGAAVASLAVGASLSFCLVGRRQAPDAAAVARALAALPAGLPRLTHLPTWPFLGRAKEDSVPSPATPPAALAGTKRPRPTEEAEGETTPAPALALSFTDAAESAVDSAPASPAEGAAVCTPTPLVEGVVPRRRGAAGAGSSRSHREALLRTAAALWAQTAWSALASSRAFSSLTGARLALADVLSVAALPLDEGASKPELVFLASRLAAPGVQA